MNIKKRKQIHTHLNETTWDNRVGEMNIFLLESS